MVRIGVTGAGGRMGRMLVRAIAEAEGARLVGGTEAPGSPHLGKDLGELAGIGTSGVAASDDAEALFAKADAVLDFTSPEASLAHARLAAQSHAVHVIGTTGIETVQEAEIARCARHAPIVLAANMSLGVTLLAALVRQVARRLGEDWDIEIVEMHHRHKVDAPSGTALLLGRAAAEGRGVALDEVSDRGRDGITGARRRGAIGFAALRGGDVTGDHTVIFAAPGERVELVHKAAGREIYARGAVRAALWAHGRDPGLYSMKDVLGLVD